MTGMIISALLYISLGLIVILVGYVMLRCETKRQPAFVAFQWALFIYLLGYLLEINAQSAEAAFIGRKILYLGSSFASPFLLIFIAGYCDFKLSKKFIGLLTAVALFIVVSLWTNDYHGLFYRTYDLGISPVVHYLAKENGPLQVVGHSFAFFCFAAVAAIVIRRYPKVEKKNRGGLHLLIFGLMLGIGANVVYLLDNSGLKINYVPIVLVSSNVFFYISIVKYDMFDIIPKASEAALESMRDAFILSDMNGNFISANKSAAQLFPEVKSIKKYSPLNQIIDWPEVLQFQERTVPHEAEYSLPGSKYYKADMSPIFSKGKHKKLLGQIILIRDVTESVELMQNLEEIAYTDMLTGILNRRHFVNLASGQFSRLKRNNDTGAYILMFDLDRFKSVNDTYGHGIGDEVLKRTAERVKNIMRPYDFFGRYGGEEFIIFVTDISGECIGQYAERVRLAICGEPMRVDAEGLELNISASFGVASIQSADNLEDVINAADAALYAAKEKGRNCVEFSCPS